MLDRDIPGPSGDEIAKRIVASGSRMPILMLTAADRLDDKATGFELGADDYLTKPFALRELVLRLQSARPPARRLQAARWRAAGSGSTRSAARSTATAATSPSPESSSPCSKSWWRAEGGVVSAEELLERAWDENADPFTNAVRITVSALRKRLGEPWVIPTVPGAGYRIDTQADTGPGGGDSG